jgi:hypothetical protein
MPLIRSASLIVIALATATPSPAIGAADAVLVPKEQRTAAPKLVFSDLPGARRHLAAIQREDRRCELLGDVVRALQSGNA